MKFFKKKSVSTSSLFYEDSLDSHFDDMMAWIKDLSRKDYNKVKKAIDSSYEAYQILHGIEPVDESSKEEKVPYAVHAKEGE